MSRFQFTILIAALVSAAHGQTRISRMVGINILLNQPVTPAILADLNTQGQVLDVIPEINAVTVRAHSSELPAIQALAYVAGANPDAECSFAGGGDGLPVPDFSGGANVWNLDAINVTDFGAGRSVVYDGEGVYIAVIDTGLPHNWREYFPEERIATQFARCFGGGAGEPGTISDQPDKWEGDTKGHGCAVTSPILGFHYAGPAPSLPTYFNGVAPKATVIPVKASDNGLGNEAPFSVLTRSLVYVTNLKVSGALGGAPLVVNMSLVAPEGDIVFRAAIDHAIANGVIVVSVAGNEANAGMGFPGAYPEVISAGMVGAVGEFPADDPTRIDWILRDIPEGDLSQFFVGPTSSRELPGQELDVAAPGWIVPVAWSANGQVDYTFGVGTSFAAPHVAGIAALMLQKNPGLTQAEIETILKDTAMPMPPGCRDTVLFSVGPGNFPQWSDLDISLFDGTVCWESNATGAGLVQADAALAATPLP